MYHNGTLAFLANPRTASTTVSELLKQRGWKGPEQHHESHYEEKYEYFTCVRNHWDAIASVLCMRGYEIWDHGPPDLATVRLLWGTVQPVFRYRAAHMREDIPALWKWVNTKYNPTVLRYEELPASVNDFLASKGIEPLDLSQRWNYGVERRKGLHYSHFFTPETKDWVWKRWKEEIKEMGYEYEEAPR